MYFDYIHPSNFSHTHSLFPTHPTLSFLFALSFSPLLLKSGLYSNQSRRGICFWHKLYLPEGIIKQTDSFSPLCIKCKQLLSQWWDSVSTSPSLYWDFGWIFNRPWGCNHCEFMGSISAVSRFLVVIYTSDFYNLSVPSFLTISEIWTDGCSV